MIEQTPEISSEQIQPEVIPVGKKPCCQPKTVLLVILGLVIVAGVLYAGIKIGRKQTQPNVIAEPTVTPQTTEVSPTPDETANWKTYTNDKFGFEFKYPNAWIVNGEMNDTKGPSANLFWLDLRRTDQSQDKRVIEPGPEGKPEYPYYSLSVIISNENYYKDSPGEEVIIGGIKGIKSVVGSAPCGPTTVSFVNYAGKAYGVEYTSCSSQENKTKYISEYDQILSTFKFTNEDTTVEGRFCGGIAANLPQNQCPEGYTCKLDGDYPDAGGKCVKN